MKRTVGATLLAVSLMMAVPASASAADGVTLANPEAGQREVVAKVAGPKSGDWYHFYVGTRYFSGILSEDTLQNGRLALTLPDGQALAAGDAVKVEVAGAQGTYHSDSKTVGDAPQVLTPGLNALYPKTVRPGEEVKGRIVLVSAGGQEQDVTNSALYSLEGPIAANSFSNGTFRVDKDAVVGSQLRVTAHLGNDVVEASMTVADGGTAVPGGGVALATNHGAVNVEHTIACRLEKPLAGLAQVALEVEGLSDASARVKAHISDADAFVKTGQGNVVVSADRPTDVQLVFIYKDATGKEIKREKLPFQFGTTLKDGQVKMTIGLKRLEIGAEQKEMDTAPFIKDDRTFVPLRALAEAFGAKVDYDDATQRITIAMGEKRIVMDINKSEYTVDGNSKTMDTPPYISFDGRTIVPVRFATEGLGFRLSVLYDKDGLTDHIIFSKA